MLDAGRDHGLEVEVVRLARARAGRPDGWPITSTCGLDAAATSRAVIRSRSRRWLWCTDATTQSSDASTSSG